MIATPGVRRADKQDKSQAPPIPEVGIPAREIKSLKRGFCRVLVFKSSIVLRRSNEL